MTSAGEQEWAGACPAAAEVPSGEQSRRAQQAELAVRIGSRQLGADPGVAGQRQGGAVRWRGSGRSNPAAGCVGGGAIGRRGMVRAVQEADQWGDAAWSGKLRVGWPEVKP